MICKSSHQNFKIKIFRKALKAQEKKIKNISTQTICLAVKILNLLTMIQRKERMIKCDEQIILYYLKIYN